MGLLLYGGNFKSQIQSKALNEVMFRSSRPGVFCKKGFLRNFAKLTGKHQCQSLNTDWHTDVFL